MVDVEHGGVDEYGGVPAGEVLGAAPVGDASRPSSRPLSTTGKVPRHRSATWPPRRCVARILPITVASGGREVGRPGGQDQQVGVRSGVGAGDVLEAKTSAVRMPPPFAVHTTPSQPVARPCRPTSPKTRRAAERWNIVMPSKVSADELHQTLPVLLHSNFAATATTDAWTAAVDAGEALPKSDLSSSATQGLAAFAG